MHVYATDAARTAHGVDGVLDWGIGGHRPAVGVAQLQRLEAAHRLRRDLAALAQRDPRQQVGVGRVRQAGDAGLPALGRQRHLHVVQGGAAAHHEQAALRVGHLKLARSLGPQLDGVVAHPPQPGLGVVHRGRETGRRSGLRKDRACRLLSHQSAAYRRVRPAVGPLVPTA
jgi:hypothetical protein